MDAKLASEVWKCLLRGAPLEGLGLPTIDGLTDLRNIVAPTPEILRRDIVAGHEVQTLSGMLEMRGVGWERLDLRGAQLKSLRFFDCAIRSCRFDDARCSDLRMWGTTMADTSFHGADLRGSALGGVDGVKRNRFVRVDFTNADLRRTAHKSADFIECTFSNTNLKSVDFQGSVFERCTFSGLLDEVLFYRAAFLGEAFPPNEMREVDLRTARLRGVQFRGLDLDGVAFPDDDEHVVIDDYRRAIDRALALLDGRTDLPARRLTAWLASYRKWAGPNQRRGVLSRADLVSVGGDQLAAEVCARLLGDH